MRPLLTVIVLAAVLVPAVSACGSSSRVSGPPPPRLPRSVAASLAARSDALAVALTRGDGCEAKVQVHALERQTRAAVAAGRVPAPYRSRLLAAVRGLAGRLPGCTPPPPAQPVEQRPRPPKHEQPQKKHEKKKHHSKGEGD